MSTKGNFVVLVSTTDEYTDLGPGDVGIVTMVDSLGTVHVKWLTKQSNLGLVPGEDSWEEFTTSETPWRKSQATLSTEEVKRELGIE